jgi:hypothetical protein
MTKRQRRESRKMKSKKRYRNLFMRKKPLFKLQ